MKRTTLSAELIEKTTQFHGHWCPGLAIGIRASEWALQEMQRAADEEVVAVVETDMCGADAIQYLTGCTFGKGNLIYKDYGKNAFTFYFRENGKAMRLVLRATIYGDAGPLLRKLHSKMESEGLSAEEEKSWKETRGAISKRIMELELTDVFEFKAPEGPLPKKARIFASLICERCGEPVMETRTRRFDDQVLCIPCFGALETRF
jgi:formylmethanofuran dehydrogenase subunit E